MPLTPFPSVPASPARAAAPPDRYHPTGHIAWPHFLPLAAAALTVAALSAYVLAGPLGNLPQDPLVLPTVLGLPAAAAAPAAVYLGRCRSRALASLLAAAAVLTYYAGSWELGFRLHVLPLGPAAAQSVERFGGTSGAIGYFLMFCRTPTRAGDLLVTTLRLLSFGALLSISLYAARRLAGRVYYDFFHRWANSFAFRFHAANLPLVRAALATGDYAPLAHLPKATAATALARAGGLQTFRLEYLPRTPDYPAYATLEGPTLARHPLLRPTLFVLPWLARFTTVHERQRLIPAPDLPALASALGIPDLLPAPTDHLAATPDGPLPYLPASPLPPSQQPAAPLTSLIRETGLLGTAPTDATPEFRAPATAASVSFLLRCGEPAIADCPLVRPGRPDFSLCLPAPEPAPLPRLKRFSLPHTVLTYSFLALILLGNLGLFATAPIADNAGPFAALAARALTACCFLFAALTFLFTYLCLRPLQTSLLASHVRRRPGFTPVPRGRGGRGGPRLYAIEDFATFHIAKRVPEDWCVCWPDPDHRRLVIEGITHRYLIRGSDVRLVEPIPGASSVAVRVTFDVAGVHPCSLALCRTSGLTVLLKGFFPIPLLGPLLSHLASLPARRESRKLRHTLGLTAS